MSVSELIAASSASAHPKSSQPHTGSGAGGTGLLDELVLTFELAPVGLCVLRNRIIQRCNRGFAEMFGYTEEALPGTSLARLYPSQEEFEHIGRIGLPAMRATGFYRDDRIMRHRDGHQFWCHVVGRSLDRADPFAYSVWMFEDISAQRPLTTRLTTREREIAQQLVTGKTSKLIAKALDISHRTVEAHRARLMKKLRVSTAGELIARLTGLI